MARQRSHEFCLMACTKLSYIGNNVSNNKKTMYKNRCVSLYLSCYAFISAAVCVNTVSFSRYLIVCITYQPTYLYNVIMIITFFIRVAILNPVEKWQSLEYWHSSSSTKFETVAFASKIFLRFFRTHIKFTDRISGNGEYGQFSTSCWNNEEPVPEDVLG